MQAALVVPRVTADAAANLATVERMSGQAAVRGAGLVVLPEAVLTGLSNNDDPAHDLPLGQTIPGPATARLGALCRSHRIWLGLGLLEREEGRLYDSAVLLGPDGSIALRYRRNQPQWHGKGADPMVYGQGTALAAAHTPWGKAAFLICGDLFDDGIVARFGGLRADWLLFPFARSFADGAIDQARWDAEELPQYARRMRMARARALMVNYLADDSLGDDRSFGGAFLVSAQGEVLAQHPLGKEGMLLVDLERGAPGPQPARG